MLIVLSDLHFADSSAYAMGIERSNLNLPGRVYHTFFKEIAELIKVGHVEKIDLVLAGDIFEITRSAMWHLDELRPYIHNEDVGETEAVEKRICDVMDAITADPKVRDTADVFKNLKTLFGMPVNIHYIPGNHDRLLNATPKIRNKVRNFFGIEKSDAFFSNTYLHYHEGDVTVLVRHGHEYDHANFGTNLALWSEIPMEIDKSYYDMPVLGDIITSEIASKLPILFKKRYGEEAILADYNLRRMYQRVIDFDNVRPNRAMMNFLFSTPGISRKEIWKMIEPVFRELLDEIAWNSRLADDVMALSNFKKLGAKAVMSILKSRIWRRGLPIWMFNALINPVMNKTGLDSDMKLLQKESFLRNGNQSLRCLVSGHTHNAIVRLLSVSDGIEKYYLNSGTFRNVITTTPNQNKFGRLRSKARVLIYEKGEQNPEYTRETGWSFDFNARMGYGADPNNSIDFMSD